MFNKIIRKYKKRFKVLKIQMLFLDKKYQEALDIVNDFLEENPNDCTFMKWKLSCYQHLKPIDDTLKYCNEILRIYPFETSSLLNVANILKSKEKYDDALSVNNMIIETNPTSLPGLYMSMTIYREMGDYEKAVGIAEKRLKCVMEYKESAYRKKELILSAYLDIAEISYEGSLYDKSLDAIKKFIEVYQKEAKKVFADFTYDIINEFSGGTIKQCINNNMKCIKELERKVREERGF